MIDLQNLSFSYPGQKALLEDVNLSIASGEVVVLCGASGSGKSTLLKILNGLIPELYEGKLDGEGTILENDFLGIDFNAYVKEIGVVFQNPKTQFFTTDVYSELAFSLENYGVSRECIIERIQEITKLLGLEKLLGHSMFNLSGGQKQLVAFASACMLEHKLFLLDEPSSNLDEKTIDQLKSYIQQLKQQGFTIIIAEHRLHYLTELADRYLVMENGNIIGNHTKEVMIKQPPESLAALGLRPLLPTAIQPRTIQPLSINEANQLLQCKDVSFHYPRKKSGIKIPNLTLDSGQIIGITGTNGAGKSTLFKLLSGITKPKKGTIWFNGQKMTPRQLIKESFMVMQDVNLQLFFESVEKEITAKAVDLSYFSTAVELLNLKYLLRRHPQTLSGGEKQRVAIATALLSGKKIIFFDEPTSGLDLKHMEEVSKTIRVLHKQHVLILIITHDKEFLSKTCHRVLAIEDGEITADYPI
ncbi:energy-coupling factor ABC transporter ATP-binding protein [Enterococcus sp. BWM-S5]|uniref:Energy-coupling factor ABC transporter ATP-binding protein n=1 Tax=Enterococcus larvae TaxID=2794352 RepID=A0ABS4CI38_9ENTE|nr:energy-coupling factor ABC transporter ATP-binding protein [Enterococcus larvae]MBP1046100.1 energy-coupling factor ABC transporter ATP-binding protein [Enterococcus larvae]